MTPNLLNKQIGIDAAKGLAILLVVIGHVRPQDIGLEWFSSFRSFIYGFHMPVFMYLSGFLFFLKGKHLLKDSAFHDYIKKRADRLLVPFFVFGILVIFGKYLMGYIIPVGDPVSNFLDSFRYLFLETSRSPVQSIWYLFVLFVISYITPFLYRICGWWSLVLAGLLVLAPGWDFLYFDKFRSFYLFFLIGGWFSCFGQEYLKSLRVGVLSLVLFSVSSIVFFCEDYRFLPMGFFGMLAIHILLPHIGRKINAILEYFGSHSMTIYLLNTIFIGLMKGFIFLTLPNMTSELELLILILAGCIFPLIVSKILDTHIIFSRIRPYFK